MIKHSETARIIEDAFVTAEKERRDAMASLTTPLPILEVVEQPVLLLKVTLEELQMVLDRRKAQT